MDDCHGIERKCRVPSADESNVEILGQPVGAPRLPNRPLTAAQKRQQITLERLGLFDGEPQFTLGKIGRRK
jgi:hypothetical protein